MIHYLQMDGYAIYIWPAYGIAALGMIGMTIATWRGLKRKRRELAAMGEDE